MPLSRRSRLVICRARDGTRVVRFGGPTGWTHQRERDLADASPARSRSERIADELAEAVA